MDLALDRYKQGIFPDLERAEFRPRVPHKIKRPYYHICKWGWPVEMDLADLQSELQISLKHLYQILPTPHENRLVRRGVSRTPAKNRFVQLGPVSVLLSCRISLHTLPHNYMDDMTIRPELCALSYLVYIGFLLGLTG